MKKNYNRSNLLIVLLLLLVGTIVYSCRKDKQENLTEPKIMDQQLLQAKTWYESNFSSNNTITITNSLATHVNTTSNTNPSSWDHIFSPAWAKVNTFVIDSITYFELPVVKTNGDFAISRKDKGNAKYDFTKSLSRSSIILRKSKTGFAAYLMTIVADSSYLNGDFTKLANNTYQKKDKNFSGLVFYHNLNGTFNNGWQYIDGKITGTISQKPSVISSDKTVLLLAAPSFDCQNIPIYSTTMTCTSSGNGTYDMTCNENTHIDYITICGNGSNNPPNISAAGNPGNTGAGGGITTPILTASQSFLNNIDASKLKLCMQAILNNVKALSNGSVAGIIQRFSGNTPGYNWKVQDGTLPTNINAQTTSGYDRTTGTVTTTFDSQKLINASDLSIARTILHESVHAYLVAFFENNRGDQNAFAKTYPELYNQYLSDNGATNDNQHTQMASSFVADIATALKEYGKNRGYNIIDPNFYSDMAWGGLTGTKAFNNLSQTDKTE